LVKTLISKHNEGKIIYFGRKLTKQVARTK